MLKKFFGYSLLAVILMGLIATEGWASAPVEKKETIHVINMLIDKQDSNSKCIESNIFKHCCPVKI